jgi:hypothetical protein
VATERKELVLRHKSDEVGRMQADIDVDDSDQMRAHLVAAIERNGGRERDIGEYVLDVHKPGYVDPQFTYAALGS